MAHGHGSYRQTLYLTDLCEAGELKTTDFRPSRQTPLSTFYKMCSLLSFAGGFNSPFRHLGVGQVGEGESCARRPPLTNRRPDLNNLKSLSRYGDVGSWVAPHQFT